MAVIGRQSKPILQTVNQSKNKKDKGPIKPQIVKKRFEKDEISR